MDYWSTIDPIITVDDRERASGLFASLQESDLFQIEERRLESGDVVVADLGIERKTFDDFVASIYDGRLFRQVFMLKRVYPRRLLIVENPSGMHGSPAILKQVQGAIARIVGSLQVPVLTTSSVDETAIYIQRVAFQLFGFTHSRQILRGPLKPRDLQHEQLFVLVGIAGLGLTRARALLQHFGSIRAIFSAPAEDIANVSEIGPVIAERIVTVGATESCATQERES